MPEEPEAPPRRSGRRGRSRQEFEERAHATVAEIEAQVRATKAQLDAIEERIEARTGRNLPLAILIGLGLGFALLFSLILVKALYLVFAAALVVFTTYELATALRSAGRDVPRIPTIIVAVALLPLAFFLGAAGLWLGFLAAVAVISLWRLAEWMQPKHRTTAGELARDLGAGVFILSYIGILGALTVLLTAQEDGEWWTLAFLIVVVGADTGAYASGLLWGRHPLAPRISPKKTWEGFLGSVTVAVVLGIFLAEFMIFVPWWAGMLFGLVLVGTATLGDLVESLIKRDLGIKDISSFLPGHGGFLDRVDSALPSAAAAYVLYLLFT